MKIIDLLALAGQTPPGTEPDPRASLIQMVGMFVLLGVMFYFLLIRPQQKQRKEHEALIKNLKTGDKVLLSCGIIGIISNVKEKTLMVKIADHVKIEVLRTAVSSVLQKSDSDTEPQKS
ncbi:MAG: preprotein translocase subunit YajC [Verrucomicrobiae bacterium]|nr:preprotein translocase subunit YajC [Verrucomicrobiae bacterium]